MRQRTITEFFYFKRKNIMGAARNLIGERFGRLTVIEKTDKRKNGSIVWKCQCDCGNIC